MILISGQASLFTSRKICKTENKNQGNLGGRRGGILKIFEIYGNVRIDVRQLK